MKLSPSVELSPASSTDISALRTWYADCIVMSARRSDIVRLARSERGMEYLREQFGPGAP